MSILSQESLLTNVSTFNVKLRQISWYFQSSLNQIYQIIEQNIAFLQMIWTKKSIWLKFFFLRMISHKICDCAVLISLFNLGSTQKSDDAVFSLNILKIYFTIWYIWRIFLHLQKDYLSTYFNKINQMKCCILYSTILNIFFFRVLIISFLKTLKSPK